MSVAFALVRHDHEIVREKAKPGQDLFDDGTSRVEVEESLVESEPCRSSAGQHNPACWLNRRASAARSRKASYGVSLSLQLPGLSSPLAEMLHTARLSGG